MIPTATARMIRLRDFANARSYPDRTDPDTLCMLLHRSPLSPGPAVFREPVSTLALARARFFGTCAGLALLLPPLTKQDCGTINYRGPAGPVHRRSTQRRRPAARGSDLARRRAGPRRRDRQARG